MGELAAGFVCDAFSSGNTFAGASVPSDAATVSEFAVGFASVASVSVAKSVDAENPWVEDWTASAAVVGLRSVAAIAGERLTASKPKAVNTSAEDAVFSILHWDFTGLKLLKTHHICWNSTLILCQPLLMLFITFH